MNAVKQLAYSSMLAFLAHFRLLSDAAARSGGPDPLSAGDHEILGTMRQLMEGLTLEERAILLADAAGAGSCISAEKRRQSARAEQKLRRLLLVKGVLRG